MNRRLFFSYCLILATFALTAMWLRLPHAIPPLPGDLYSARYLILIPMALSLLACLFNGIRPAFDERVAWALMLVAFGMWAFASREWAFVSNFPTNSVNYRPEVAASAALQVAFALLFALVVLWTRPPLRWLSVVVAVLVLCQSVIVTLQVEAQGPIGLGWLGESGMTPQTPGASVLTAGEIRWLRPYGLLPHPNNLGGWLAVGTLISGALLFEPEDDSLLRWLGIVAVCAGLGALLLTFSRGAWLGFAAGTVVALVLTWQEIWKAPASRQSFVIVALGSLFIVGGFFRNYAPLIQARVATPFQASERTQQAVDIGLIESTEARSLVDREVYSHLAHRSIQANPIRGVGIGNFPWQASRYLMDTDMDLRGNYVHNVYLAAWADLGVIGLLLFVGGGLGAVALALRHPFNPARVAAIAGAIALAVAGFFDYYAWALLPFQVLWWGLLAAAVADAYPPPSQPNVEDHTEAVAPHLTAVGEPGL